MKKATRLSTGGLGHVCECWHKASKSSEGVTHTDLHAGLAFTSARAGGVQVLRSQAQAGSILVVHVGDRAVHSRTLGQIVDITQADVVSLGVDGLLVVHCVLQLDFASAHGSGNTGSKR